MKPYIREFAEDILRMNNPAVKSGAYRHPRKVDIMRVLAYVDDGKISNVEALRRIIQIDDETREAGLPWLASTHDFTQNGRRKP